MPRVLRPCFSSQDDSVKDLAVEVYAELLKKIGEFGKQFKNGQINPNDEELKCSEELVDAIYENNKVLISTYPWITTKTKINEFASSTSGNKEKNSWEKNW